MNEQLLALAIQETPAIIAALTALFVKQHPDAAVPTSEDVIAAYHTALSLSLVKDATWISNHPA